MARVPNRGLLNINKYRDSSQVKRFLFLLWSRKYNENKLSGWQKIKTIGHKIISEDPLIKDI